MKIVVIRSCGDYIPPVIAGSPNPIGDTHAPTMQRKGRYDSKPASSLTPRQSKSKKPGVNPALLLRTSITASGREVEAEEWATPLSRWF
jgi:hypothetical protein